MATTDLISIERHGPVQLIRMQREDKKNALTHAMYSSINLALEEAADNSDIRVSVITGGERCFTSGNDISDFLHTPPSGDDAPVMQFLQNLYKAPKPVLAAVSGIAVGVGTTMLPHMDMVYASADASFQFPFVNLALCPEAGSSYLLPLLAGYARASELLMLGEPFDANEALRIGLINRIISNGDVLAYTMERAQRLASQPPAAIRLTKRLIRQGQQTRLEDMAAEEGRQFLQRLSSPEAMEAFSAFMQKRKPDFSRFG